MKDTRSSLLGESSGEVRLASVGVFYIWDGPVCKALVPPWSMEHWDEERKKTDYEERDLRMRNAIWSGGVHAFKKISDAMWAASYYRADVIGLVDLWGRVIQFELGFKAEYAMVMKIAFLSERFESVLKKSGGCREIENIYGCEIIELKEMVNIAEGVD